MPVRLSSLPLFSLGFIITGRNMLVLQFLHIALPFIGASFDALPVITLSLGILNCIFYALRISATHHYHELTLTALSFLLI